MSQNVLRLGSCGLTPSEIVLIRTLLRLSAHNRDVNWVYVAYPPHDAVLLDDPDGNATLADLDAETPYVLRLTRINAGRAPGTLERPIRSEKLFQWLDGVERDLANGARSDTTAAHSARVDPAGFSATASRQTMAQDLSAAAPRLRLRRWPPASIVRDSGERVRMAKLLARRALNAHDLHRLTGLDAIECLVFMKTLHAGKLLVPPSMTERERKNVAE